MRDFMRRVLGEKDFLGRRMPADQFGEMEAQKLQWQVQELSIRVGQLEVVCAAAFDLLQMRGLSRDDLNLAVARIDLEDGVEDGRIGPDRSAIAPACGSCGKPVNPKRDVCVFCGTEWAHPVQMAEHVHCHMCGEKFDTADTWFTESGVVCNPCLNTATDGFAGTAAFAAR